MPGFRDYSILKKLTRMNMMVSSVALGLACVALITYDLISVREAMLHQLLIQAQIIGSNSISALAFDDLEESIRANDLRRDLELVRDLEQEGRDFPGGTGVRPLEGGRPVAALAWRPGRLPELRHAPLRGLARLAAM